MAARSGALMLIKVGDGAPSETFTTVGGIRNTSMILNNHPIQSNHMASGIWRESLENSGMQSLTISGDGMFTETDAEELIRGYAFAGGINNYRLIFANGDYITGAFVVSHYARGGDYEAEERYAITLESAGEITFTAA